MNKKNNFVTNIIKKIMEEKVVILFAVISILGVIISGTSPAFILSELTGRFVRNTFIALALIVPVVAGLGMNFGITVGGMAVQLSIFTALYNGLTGIPALIAILCMAIPLAMLFGWLLGLLYNKTKGGEMITGLVFSYLASGIYQFILLFGVGGIIDADESTGLIIPGGIGVKNTIDLTGKIKGVIDGIEYGKFFIIVLAVYIVIGLVSIIIRSKANMKDAAATKTFVAKTVFFAIITVAANLPFVGETFGVAKIKLVNLLMLYGIIAIVYQLYMFAMNKFVIKEECTIKDCIVKCLVPAIALVLSFIPVVQDLCMLTQVPIVTFSWIIGVGMFNNWILSTKLGQDMRTVGQNRAVANSSGINVDKIRTIATMISTVLAAIGQLIYLQGIGTFGTYTAHGNIGTFNVAALLVGGASIVSAKNSHGVVGIIIFHALFIVAPMAAGVLFGNALIGEHFRVFLCYAVIALSLAIHAWEKGPKKSKKAKA
ncbi:MAG: ABC transporter permease [Eubacteriaceae bacterium]|nr:ABC transporter permease [Eubacteriaceae bacterium]